jgi:hypothetical protein
MPPRLIMTASIRHAEIRNPLNGEFSTDIGGRAEPARRSGQQWSYDGCRMQKDGSSVFISYSHNDAKWLKKLKIVLKPLTRDRTMSIWDDTVISAGAKWKQQIKEALDAASIAVLLVTPDFLASDFIAANELPPLLKAADEEGVTIIWIAVKASLHKSTPISEYQAANDPSKPLESLKGALLNKELVNIAEKIAAVAVRRTELQTDSVPEWGDLILAYGYKFDRPIMLADIDQDWTLAYHEFSETGGLRYLHQALVSHLPRRGPAGAEELDLEKMDQIFDYLVMKGYLKREREIIFKRRFSLTDAGRAYFSNKREVILARYGIEVASS